MLEAHADPVAETDTDPVAEGHANPTAVADEIRQQISDERVQTYQLHFGHSFRKAADIACQDPKYLPLFQAAVAEGVQSLVDKRRVGRLAEILRELQRTDLNHDLYARADSGLLDGVKPEQITATLDLFDAPLKHRWHGIQPILHNLSDAENLIAVAVAVADRPALAQSFKSEYAKFHSSSHETINLRFAGLIEDDHIDIADTTLANVMALGVEPQSVSSGTMRWDFNPLFPIDGVEVHELTAKTKLFGGTQLGFAHRRKDVARGEVPPPGVFEFLFADGHKVLKVYIGKVMPIADALKHAADELSETRFSNIKRKRTIHRLMGELQNLAKSKMDDNTESKLDNHVVWREQNHNGLPSFVEPAEKTFYAIAEGEPIPLDRSELAQHHSPVPVSKLTA